MLQNPTKGDWASSAAKLFKKYELDMNLDEIQNIKPSIFKNLVKKHIRKVAFKELVDQQQSKQKGKFIKYESLQMAEYLLPEANLDILDKLEIFSLRTEMNSNPYNFGKKTSCEIGCPEEQNNQHIFYCSKVNIEENKLIFEHILNGSTFEKVNVLRKFQENMKKRNHLLDSATPVNPL